MRIGHSGLTARRRCPWPWEANRGTQRSRNAEPPGTAGVLEGRQGAGGAVVIVPGCEGPFLTHGELGLPGRTTSSCWLSFPFPGEAPKGLRYSALSSSPGQEEDWEE